MTQNYSTVSSLVADFSKLGIGSGDGVFVHASLGAIGNVVGGARTVIEALITLTGKDGLLAMPGFSTDAYFPAFIDWHELSEQENCEIEAVVPGHDPALSSAMGMGIIAETFRKWPDTLRSQHPTSSVCLRGADAAKYIAPHSLDWASGPISPCGRLVERPQMKILLIGVGWNRCSALHTAENLADPMRTKIRRFKPAHDALEWQETPDVADDMDRLFPLVGADFERDGIVQQGRVGAATSRLCNYRELVTYAAKWISTTNRKSGDLH